MSNFHITWHIITGEYPPSPGGVSDYTRIVARGLAEAGDEVHIWAPFHGQIPTFDPGIIVHPLPDHFGLKSLRTMGARLNAWPTQARILVQYVPHGFGWKAMNLPFTRWLGYRRQPVWILFHEVAYPLREKQPFRHSVLAKVQRWMARNVVKAANRILVTIPIWADVLKSILPTPIHTTWLPIPSNIPRTEAPDLSQKYRNVLRNGTSDRVIVHFGTYGAAIQNMLAPIIHQILLNSSDIRFLLAGRGGSSFATTLLLQFPQFQHRIDVREDLSPEELSLHLQAADLAIQPYPDGASTRRTSLMAMLANGVPTITTDGVATEEIWRESGAVALVNPEKIDVICQRVFDLLDHPEHLRSISVSARSLYEAKFSFEHTIQILRSR